MSYISCNRATLPFAILCTCTQSASTAWSLLLRRPLVWPRTTTFPSAPKKSGGSKRTNYFVRIMKYLLR